MDADVQPPHKTTQEICQDIITSAMAEVPVPAAVVQPLVNDADLVAGQQQLGLHSTEEVEQVPAWDCGLACFCLLNLLSITYMQTWLEKDPERRTLFLLRKKIPGLMQTVAAICAEIDARKKKGHPHQVKIHKIFEENANLMSFCYNNLQTIYFAMGSASRQVRVDRFLPHAGDQPTRSPNTACDRHCAQALLKWKSFVTYDGLYCVAEDGDSVRISRDMDLRDVWRAYKATDAFYKGLRLCTIAGLAEGGAQLLISDCEFVTLAHYNQLARQHEAAQKSREQLCGRRRRCLECAMSPATLVFAEFGASTAPVCASVTAQPDSALSPDYLEKWKSPRCIHTELTWLHGADKVRRALLWFFGGVENPAQVLLSVADHLMRDGEGTLRSAMEMIHDSVIVDFLVLETEDEAVASGVRAQYIQPSLRMNQLYSHKLRRVLTTCALIQ